MDKETIKELRHKLGLSQEGLARKLGVSVITVRRWEKGSFKPSPLALQRIEELIKETKTGPL
jgi:DNA-binding transcriptional regulator YiaG